jgi:hypothetical protein
LSYTQETKSGSITDTSNQGCKKPECQVDRATNFCTVAQLLWVLSLEFASRQHPSALNLEAVPILFENIWNSDLKKHLPTLSAVSKHGRTKMISVTVWLTLCFNSDSETNYEDITKDRSNYRHACFI